MLNSGMVVVITAQSASLFRRECSEESGDIAYSPAQTRQILEVLEYEIKRAKSLDRVSKVRDYCAR